MLAIEVLNESENEVLPRNERIAIRKFQRSVVKSERKARFVRERTIFGVYYAALHATRNAVGAEIARKAVLYALAEHSAALYCDPFYDGLRADEARLARLKKGERC